MVEIMDPWDLPFVSLSNILSFSIKEESLLCIFGLIMTLEKQWEDSSLITGNQSLME